VVEQNHHKGWLGSTSMGHDSISLLSMSSILSSESLTCKILWIIDSVSSLILVGSWRIQAIFRRPRSSASMAVIYSPKISMESHHLMPRQNYRIDSPNRPFPQDYSPPAAQGTPPYPKSSTSEDSRYSDVSQKQYYVPSLQKLVTCFQNMSIHLGRSTWYILEGSVEWV